MHTFFLLWERDTFKIQIKLKNKKKFITISKALKVSASSYQQCSDIASPTAASAYDDYIACYLMATIYLGKLQLLFGIYRLLSILLPLSRMWQHYTMGNHVVIRTSETLFRIIMISFAFLYEARLTLSGDNFLVTVGDGGCHDSWQPAYLFSLSSWPVGLVFMWNKTSNQYLHFCAIYLWPVCNGLTKHEASKTQWCVEHFKLLDVRNASYLPYISFHWLTFYFSCNYAIALNKI